MPIYNYQCPQCREETERMVRVDAPNPTCKVCSTPDKKVFYERMFPKGTSFVLKGGGWAKDNYSSK